MKELSMFYVPVRMPGMNEIIAKAKSGRGNKNAYSRMKAEFTGIVRMAIIHYNINPVSCPVIIKFSWIEANRRRDPDNIVAGRKFILDGLVESGVLPDDGWDQVKGFRDSWSRGVKSGVWVSLWTT